MRFGGRMLLSSLVVLAGSATATRAPAAPLVDPFQAATMRAFLAGRAGEVTAAVEDLRTGRTAVYHPGVLEQTASIAKLDILETLLRERGPLSGASARTATGMIEASDNKDADRLWNEAGGAPAVAGFDARAGMRSTVPDPNGHWGLSWTTALDQLRLLRQLVLAHGLLSAAEQAYALSLMEHVEASQAWGVSGGVAPGAGVALKNGWLPVSGGWQVNSIGLVRGGSNRYLLAILTREDPSFAYGVATTAGIAARVWRLLAAPQLVRMRPVGPPWLRSHRLHRPHLDERPRQHRGQGVGGSSRKRGGA